MNVFKKQCYIPQLLAQILLIYLLSNVLYLIFSRNVGTPFNDSLSVQQKAIKAESSTMRRNIFLVSLLVATLIIKYLKPFKNKIIST